MAEELIARGHTISGCARSQPGVDALAKKYGEPHSFSVVDVADDRSVRAWAEAVLARRGAPDLLLNNAALINTSAPLWEVEPDEFSHVVDVNIKGVFHVIRAFVPAVIGRGKGVIVNFSSGWGRSTAPEVAPYCATKYAIEGLTQALAQELPRGVAAVPLNPGIIDTDMLRSAFGSGASSYPSPSEWAKKAVPFLLGLGANDNGKSLTVR
jgi:NAD(P)-dependent dehydrogenase (short-subunit alcohol dehydrogenase family)